jgi:hypothetical protein
MKTATVLAAAAGMGLASVAMAQIDLNAGNMSLLPGGPVTLNFNVAQNVAVTGFSFSGTCSFLASIGSWASDTRLTISAPGGASATIGGYDNQASSTFLWAFQGGASSAPGNYTSGPHNMAFGNANGNWTLKFENDWNFSGSQIDWQNVHVTLIPAPGAMALLGLGGLLAGRRRR